MKKLKEFLVFCLSTALSLSLLAACGKPQIPMAGAETPAEPSSAASEGSLRVMASFYPMYDFAQKIGGDKVTVTNMVPAGTEPMTGSHPPLTSWLWSRRMCLYTAAPVWSTGWRTCWPLWITRAW